MVEANYSYLTDVLNNLGFGEIFNEKLRSSMKMDLAKIELKATEPRKNGEFSYNVVLEKGKRENMAPDQEKFWFANRIEVSFKKNGEDEPRLHTFGLYKQRGHNVHQMRNLMNGNFVHNTFKKGDETIGRWQHIDFGTAKEDGTHPLKSIYDRTIQWNITRDLSALPHSNSLTQEMKEDMIRALRNGDNVAATLKNEGKWEPLYLKANPKAARIDVYNADSVKVNLTKTTMQLVQESPAAKESMKESAKMLVAGENQQTTGKGLRAGSQ